jgi:hypothetical protein
VWCAGESEKDRREGGREGGRGAIPEEEEKEWRRRATQRGQKSQEGGREGGRETVPCQQPLHEGREHLQVLLVPRGDHVNGGPTHVVLGLDAPVLVSVRACPLPSPTTTFLCCCWRREGREGGREGR